VSPANAALVGRTKDTVAANTVRSYSRQRATGLFGGPVLGDPVLCDPVLCDPALRTVRIGNVRSAGKSSRPTNVRLEACAVDAGSVARAIAACSPLTVDASCYTVHLATTRLRHKGNGVVVFRSFVPDLCLSRWESDRRDTAPLAALRSRPAKPAQDAAAKHARPSRSVMICM
jgi:uncharacterized Fe-S cluster-containing radical SAM superfamily protein